MTRERPDVRSGPGPGDGIAERSVAAVRSECEAVPAIAIVLGSGLGDAVAADLEECHTFDYAALPGFPAPVVPGHAGRLSIGRLYDVDAVLFRGRIHHYEGHGLAATTLITRMAAALGAETLVLTNAAGGIRPGLTRGRLMVIEDHLNFLGQGTLTGWRWPDGTPAFVDHSAVYDPELRAAAGKAAADEGVELSAGVYAAVPGPAYETPAEVRFLAGAGADAVGMSTVPEATAGRALGLRVLGLSCITNVAGTPSSHDDVLRAAAEGGEALRRLLRRILPTVSGTTDRP
ncbi:MAG: purine-nucleoside phosphorylase [Actinomycetota bacterium]